MIVVGIDISRKEQILPGILIQIKAITSSIFISIKVLANSHSEP